MHRFFFLFIIWILVEAYWIAPQSQKAVLDITKIRSAKQPCIEELPMDSLDQKSELVIMK